MLPRCTRQFRRHTRRYKRQSRNLRLRRLFVATLNTAGVIHPTHSGLGYSLDLLVAPFSTHFRGKQPHQQLYLNPNFVLDSTFQQNVQTQLLRLQQPSSTDVNNFLNSFNVLDFHHLHKQYFTRLTRLSLSGYTRLSKTDVNFNKILFQARGLQTTLTQYHEHLPLTSPLIYTSTKPTELPIVIDTGASCSITPSVTDFLTAPTKADIASMEGLNGNATKVVGAGAVAWDIEDVTGQRGTIRTKSYYIPQANVRLFSPQTYIEENTDLGASNCRFELTSKGASLTLTDKTVLRFPIQRQNNLPMMLSHKALHPSPPTINKPHKPTQIRFDNLVNFMCSQTFEYFNSHASFAFNNTIPVPGKLDDIQPVMARSNWNMTPDQRELFLWHCRCGHLSFDHIKTLLAKSRDNNNERIIKPSNHKSSHCHSPLCEACQYAKQKRRNPPSQLKQTRKELVGGLSNNMLQPGDRVSVDLYQSPTRGRLPDTYGKEKSDKQYTGGAIFIDHATKLIHNTHQFTTTAAESVNSKHKFESFCDDHGISISQYLADNNPFHAAEWKSDCDNQGQKRTYSGVGAHHQNYVERPIQTIFNMSRAMLLHLSIHWPQMADPQLWPFAVDHAVYLWNNIPNSETRLSPYELFTQATYLNRNHLQRLHVFGCPVYVLDPTLQDGKRLPKWKKRSRRGLYLGVSKLHSTTVHLVLNIETGKISPQYHVVFDDQFTTVYSEGQFTNNVWSSLVESNLERHPHIQTAPDVTPFRPSETDNSSTTEAPSSKVTQIDTGIPLVPHGTITSAPEGANDSVEETNPNSKEGGVPSSPGGVAPEKIATPITPPSPRRSTRIRQPIDRLTFFINQSDYHKQLKEMRYQLPLPSGSFQHNFNFNSRRERIHHHKLDQQYFASLQWDQLQSFLSTSQSSLASFIAQHKLNSCYDQLVEYLHPSLFATLANKEDNPTYKEAMSSPDAAGFTKAMAAEIATLIELDVFDIVNRPNNQKVISGVWAFKRKRYPGGAIRKLKARYCARGFEQQFGVDYFETFAPVVMWLTVRLLLIMSILMQLETKQIDYTAAFVHADIDCVVYVDMPQGFREAGKVWRLKKSLYGLAQSPRNFFLHTKKQLTMKFGFVQSEADPCLFISRDIICLIYVDDALLFYKDKVAMDRLASAMKDAKVAFREEEDVAGFLGVHIDRRDDGTIHLTQRGLAERIVDALHLTDSSIKPTQTPCTHFLPIDSDGEAAHENFSYPSVVGQLNYLAGHTRCDIALATSQVARFVHSPKRSHELALIQIGRYLKGTLDKGLILRPTAIETLNVNIYVDAAFACGWQTEEGSNPDSVKSRTGYIIEIANCPVMWVSKLQTTIATSTMESEYTALSMCLRAAIPMLAVLKSVINGLRYCQDRKITIKATVHEDNQGALVLAKLEPGRGTPRSKFYAIKLHWFRSWIEPNKIALEFIDTTDQKADFLTKPLSSRLLSQNRRLSMGW